MTTPGPNENEPPAPPAGASVAEKRAHELLLALWNDKDVGARIQAKAKEKWPEDVTTSQERLDPYLQPLLDGQKALQDQLKKFEEDREADRKAAKERDDASNQKNFEDSIAKASKAYNLTAEGFELMVKRMKDTGNYGDPEAAAAWVASKTPPEPGPAKKFGPQNINLFGTHERDERLAELHRDPLAYMDRELAEFVSDPDKYTRETLGH